MRRLTISIICLFYLLILFQFGAGEEIKFDDLYSYPMVGSPRFSPDSEQILFTVKTYDLKTNSSEKHIWKMNIDGSKQARVDNDSSDKWNPIWLQNGKQLIYESNKEKTYQIYLQDFENSSSKKLTSLTMGAWDAILSPIGDKILFVSESYPGCVTDSCNQIRKEKEESNPIIAKLYDKLMFRHYKYWDDDLKQQLFIYDIQNDSVYQLTNETSDVPTTTLGGHTDYCFSNDGSEICFVMNRDSILALSTNNDLFTVFSAGGVPTKITNNKGQDHTPRYSPDGKYISFRSQARAGYESDQYELKLYNRKSGEVTNLTAEFDYSIGCYNWGPKSNYIYFDAIKNGFNMLWRINTKNHKIENLLHDSVYDDLDSALSEFKNIC